MKLFEIRQSIIEQELNKPNCRDAARLFIKSMPANYQVALTLTLKPKWYSKNGHMRVERYLTVEHIPQIYERFQHKLNKLIWRQKYYRHNAESLRFLRTYENGKGKKRIHLHAAIGNFPPDFKFNTLPSLVDKASQECCEIDFQHKEDICDLDWIDYITKEVEKDNTDNIIW